MTSAASDRIYCFKCGSKTDTLEAQEVVLQNGCPAAACRSTTTIAHKGSEPRESSLPRGAPAGTGPGPSVRRQLPARMRDG